MSEQSEATRGYVQAGPTRLSYLDWGGAGPPALLLHGITSDAMAFWRVAPALRELGYRVIAVDMPGHGASDPSVGHHIDSIAGLVGDLVVALDLDAVRLLGHSWGGATALALASGAHPGRERIARVVAVDPAVAMAASWGAERLPAYLEGVGLPASDAARARIAANNPGWLAEDIHWKALALEHCRATQVAGFFTPSEEWQIAPRLGHVAVPLLVLVADAAFTVIAPELLAELHANLPSALGRVVVTPGTNHNMLRGPGFAPTMAAMVEWLAMPA